MESIEERTYWGDLFETYKFSLTLKQREVFEDYYLNDLSLSEIAENLSISRAAVEDTIKKTRKKLQEEEINLKVMENKHELQEILDKILKSEGEEKDRYIMMLKEKIDGI